MIEKENINFYFNVLNRYDQYINLANTKAQNQIVLLGSLIIATTGLIGWGLENEARMFSLSTTNIILIVAYLIYLFFSYKWYRRCILIINPNIISFKNKNSSENEKNNERKLSTIFYGDVDKFTCSKKFIDEVRSRESIEHFDDLLEQVHVMAHITNKKFTDYKKNNVWSRLTFSVLIFILFVSVYAKYS